MEWMLGYLFIFTARMTDVSMATIRMLMVVQGRKLQAALIGFFEIIIYVVALNQVFNDFNDPFKLLAYGLGFAMGNYVGCVIEDKIALGNLSAELILHHDSDLAIVEILRDNGFGVTVISAMGKLGDKKILKVTLKRKNLALLHKAIEESGVNVFVTISDVRHIKGGYFASQAIKKK
ncbi:MAG: DUF5698 domain-containing protein [Tissierellales bacterium]|jgi:uncharacterized protein YebE (UPF0316 family)|nr:DUF5698 domain-containing protein [Tissierellales bacterium]